jgi:endoglucanase
MRRLVLSVSLVAIACSYREPEGPPQAAWTSAPPETHKDEVAPTQKTEPTSDVAVSWWTTPYPTPFPSESLAKRPPRVSTKENRFVDEAGNTLVFRGVSIADPDLLMREGHLNAELFRTIRSWGANVVRVPVHPAAFRGIGPTAYFNLLDQTVRLASGSDLYVIIDWHSIGNLKTGMFQHPMYDTSQQETYEFWRAIAFRYAGVSTVAFFELFNEPTTMSGKLGHVTWTDWRTINEELIDIVRAHNSSAVPLVAGFDWAYELENVVKEPIRRPHVGYVSHPYPMKTERPFEAKWEASFGHVADHYPLMATEIGFALPNTKGAHNPVVDDGRYPEEVTAYLNKKGASWVAWVFHPEWAPQMIENWSYKPTASGEAFRKLMLNEQAKAPSTSP